MGLRDRLKAGAIDAYLGEALVHRRRTLRRLTRRGDRVVTFVHQVDDAHSHLLAQCLRALTAGFDLGLKILVVRPSNAALDPEPDRRRRWSLEDARMLARRHGLALPAAGPLPPADAVALANRVAGVGRPADAQLDVLRRVGEALFGGDRSTLEGLAADAGALSEDAWETLATQNTRALRALGHYQGAVLHYEGENYWGLDRLPFLEDRLRDEGLVAPSCVPAARPLADAIPNTSGPDTPLEFFFSFRSPYSYLAVGRTLALAKRTGVPLKIRPVLPMVMRGLPVPRVKRMYIVRDAARLARRLQIPFGRVCDPVGLGVKRCLALCGHAEAQGRLGEFVDSATRGIWSEGLNVAKDDDLEAIVTRSGLDWMMARSHLKDPSWRERAGANRQALLDMGLWGVPSYRYGAQVTWGQDRLFWVEAMLGEG